MNFAKDPTRGWLAATFGTDLRSLALFRVLLSSAVIAYLLCRFPHTTAFLTDSGVLPREALVRLDGSSRFSIYLANGQLWFSALLQLLTLAAALALWLGYRSRQAVVAVFILYASLVSRNPFVATGADSLVCSLLFWSMFLPIGARWSIDAALSTLPPPESDRHLSPASAGLVLHVLATFVLGVAMAKGSDALFELPFVAYASLAALLGGPLWNWARERADHGRRLRLFYDRDCGFCRKSCLLLRHLLVLPRTEIDVAQDHARPRRLMENSYTWVAIDDEDVAHTKWNVFVAMLRHSLLFRWIAPVAALGIWERPGNAVYDWVGRHRERFGAVTAALLPPRAIAFEPGRGTQFAAGTMIVVVFLWNLGAVGWMPRSALAFVQPVLQPLAMDTPWSRVAPVRHDRDAWSVFPGVLEDGTRVDVLRPGEPLTWTRPEGGPHRYDVGLWRTYRQRIGQASSTEQRKHFGDYLCRNWNATAEPGRALRKFEMVDIKSLSAGGGTKPVRERNVVWRQDCDPQTTS